jgi:hypothetical protein
MKKFEDLNHFQREDAIKTITLGVIDDLSEGILEIELVDPANQKELLRIIKLAVDKDSPRFAVLSLLNHKGIRGEIERLALVAASESTYTDSGSLMKEGSYVDPVLN